MTVTPFGDTVLQVKVAPQGKEGSIIDPANRKKPADDRDTMKSLRRVRRKKCKPKPQKTCFPEGGGIVKGVSKVVARGNGA